ncbi:hypothetical protein B4U80_10936 [Leptotrombidium deliense]|uniref:Uncharacterized protein n=1 Tax=Leptotrombidium deliense TaxID=299467 RepID=A0A443ST62_9ACAR|nr:hypothetical protein B4U80_10936 [Leptotrombidium deliense]
MSFSVYGSDHSYVCGVLRQIRLAKLFFPDWSARIYLNSSVPENFVSIMQREAEIVLMEDNSPLSTSGMFWRFLVADDNNVDVYCIRDSDSVFTYREAIAVQKWLSSDKSFCSMRDHEYHGINILGGGLCGRKRIRNIDNLISNWKNRDQYQNDQSFLNSKIWPLVKDDVLIYDS